MNNKTFDMDLAEKVKLQEERNERKEDIRQRAMMTCVVVGIPLSIFLIAVAIRVKFGVVI